MSRFKDYGIEMKSLYGKVKYMLGAAFILAAPFLLLWVCPDMENQSSLCPFMRWLEFPCPGCGLTKSLLCLGQGRFTSSWTYNPFGVVIELLAILIFLLEILDICNKTNKVDFFMNNPLFWKIMAIAFLVFYIIRIICTIKGGIVFSRSINL